MTSPIPAIEHGIIPARFRIFPNYDPGKTGVEGKEVQPGLLRGPLYQNSYRDFQGGDNLAHR